ncbi:CBS domain-containing protein [Marinobacter sp. 1Y8]
MFIFASEPGRPTETRVPETIKNRQIGAVDELNEAKAAHASTDEVINPAEDSARRAAQQRAINEYGEQAQTDPDQKNAYLPVSRMETTSIYSVDKTATLAEALQEMDRHDINHLVVVADNVVAGLIDRRWVLSWLHHNKADEDVARFSVIEMPSFLTATPETDAHQLARLMLAHQRDSALVIGYDGKTTGIVTSTDYLRHYAESSAQQGDV